MRVRSCLPALCLLALCGLALRAEDAGTLTGKVRFEGDLPEAYQFDVGAKTPDAAVCSGGQGNLKPAKRLLVDKENHGVQNVVVRLSTAAGKAPANGKAFPVKRRPLIDQVNCEFTPFVEWVEAGQSLRIKSSDAVMHNIHAYKGRAGGETIFNEAMPEKDKVLTKKMEDPGLAVLGCDAGHLWMCAYVFVVENPYIEITGKDGTFAMGGIPPGTYKVTLWQAGWQVTPGAADLKTGKPLGYSYSEPLLLEATVEIKPGANTLDAVLTKDGWKK
ncbi:MAG: hypothetical protein KIS92_23845 [Planctomycetota bacterium]|nr:hypothetical protein [Planctomycetota bacterium]